MVVYWGADLQQGVLGLLGAGLQGLRRVHDGDGHEADGVVPVHRRDRHTEEPTPGGFSSSTGGNT